MESKKLGKIESVSFGLGGYQGCMLGLHVTLGDGGWGAKYSKAEWDAEQIEWSEFAKWSEEDRDGWYTDIMRYVSKLLKEAKVDSVDKLKGKPVEVTFDGNTLKEWRILTEVL
jgi:hypothetical protein